MGIFVKQYLNFEPGTKRAGVKKLLRSSLCQIIEMKMEGAGTQKF